MNIWYLYLYFILSYLFYWFLPSEKIILILSKQEPSKEILSKRSVFLRKFTGFLLFGPAAMLTAYLLGGYTPAELGIKFPSGLNSLLFLLIPTAVTVPFMLLRKAESFETDFYPQVRLNEWRITDVFQNTLFWILYLISYEFLFRGVLFFPFAAKLGFFPAAVTGTVIYSSVHIPKNAKEAIIAIPYGMLLYYISWKTSSVFIPAVLHMEMALINDFRAIKINPEMKIIKNTAGI